jgi:acyl-CoA synthetase (AMP-forming)/AMP-acid ligase II
MTTQPAARSLEDVVTPADRRAAYVATGLWDGSTMVGKVEHHAQTRPDALAVVDDHGRRATYAELWRDATTLAAHLVAHGVRPGQVVSVQLPNRYEAAVAAVAVQRAGAVLNPLLPGYRRKELRHVFETAGTRAIITMAEYRGFAYGPMIDELRADTGLDVHHVTVAGSAHQAASLEEILAAPPETPRLPEHPHADAVSELIFTSGTEAAPKAIMHTEQTANFSVRVAYQDLGMTPDDVVWMPSPVGHSTGFNYGLRMALYNGVPLVLQDQWNAGTACDLVLAENCSYTLAATTFLKDLVEEAQRRGVRLTSLQRFGCGGAPVPPDLVEAALVQGIQVLRLYGSTEVLVGTWNRPGSPLHSRKNTDGNPMSHVEVELRDDGGNPVATGAQGEIFTRGPNTCVGFFRDPERTARTFSDGWVRSGDVAVMDAAGCITIVGRKKEIIIRGGMNITPREVEDMLLQFPEVHRAAVVGLPDDRLGERACACVVLRDGATLQFSDMVQRLRASGMADYKLPERLEILPELPTTASGKIQKHEIVRGLTEGHPAGRWDRET